VISNVAKLASGALDVFSSKDGDNQSQPMWDHNQVGYQ
jgi:hypothetical protein